MPLTRPDLSIAPLSNLRDGAFEPGSIEAEWQAGIDARLAAARGPDWVAEPTRLDRMLLALRGAPDPAGNR